MPFSRLPRRRFYAWMETSWHLFYKISFLGLSIQKKRRKTKRFHTFLHGFLWWLLNHTYYSIISSAIDLLSFFFALFGTFFFVIDNVSKPNAANGFCISAWWKKKISSIIWRIFKLEDIWRNVESQNHRIFLLSNCFYGEWPCADSEVVGFLIRFRSRVWTVDFRLTVSVNRVAVSFDRSSMLIWGFRDVACGLGREIAGYVTPLQLIRLSPWLP